MSQTPRLVVMYGALRSGTTLFRLMLDRHSALLCPGESDFLFDFVEADGPDGPRYSPALRESRGLRMGLPDHRSLVPDPITLPALLQALAAPTGDTDAPILVLIAHRNLERVLRYLPGVPLIHLVRDPRDVARSSIGMGWAGTTYHGIRHWLRTEVDWFALSADLPTEQVLTVQYEDLVRTPETKLTEICGFLGLDYEPAMPAVEEVSSYKRPDGKLAEQWRRKQTPREIGLVEARIGALLTDLGYAPSGHPLIHPGPLAKIALNIQHKRTVWGWRVARFGLRDVVLAGVAKRLNWPWLGRAANARIEKTRDDNLA